MKILDKTIKKTSTLFYLILNQIFLYLQIFLFFFHEQLIKKKKKMIDIFHFFSNPYKIILLLLYQ